MTDITDREREIIERTLSSGVTEIEFLIIKACRLLRYGTQMGDDEHVEQAFHDLSGVISAYCEDAEIIEGVVHFNMPGLEA